MGKLSRHFADLGCIISPCTGPGMEGCIAQIVRTRRQNIAFFVGIDGQIQIAAILPVGCCTGRTGYLTQSIGVEHKQQLIALLDSSFGDSKCHRITGKQQSLDFLAVKNYIAISLLMDYGQDDTISICVIPTGDVNIIITDILIDHISRQNTVCLGSIAQSCNFAVTRYNCTVASHLEGFATTYRGSIHPDTILIHCRFKCLHRKTGVIREAIYSLLCTKGSGIGICLTHNRGLIYLLHTITFSLSKNRHSAEQSR